MSADRDFIKYIDDFENEDFVPDDSDLNKRAERELSDRDRYYTELIDLCVGEYEKRNSQKHKLKIIFFVTLLVGMLLIIGASIYIITKMDVIKSDISVLITPILGFVSATVAIPIVIAKYLFNPGEDKYINDVLIHMVNSDLESRTLYKGGQGSTGEDSK